MAGATFESLYNSSTSANEVGNGGGGEAGGLGVVAKREAIKTDDFRGLIGSCVGTATGKSSREETGINGGAVADNDGFR